MSEEIINRNRPDRATAMEVLMPNGGWWGEVNGKFFCDEGLTLPTEEEIQAKLTELINAEPMRLLREERNRLLAETDWTQSRDVTLSNDTDWKSYRKSLRDLPSTASPKLNEFGFLTNVTWPTKPT